MATVYLFDFTSDNGDGVRSGVSSVPRDLSREGYTPIGPACDEAHVEAPASPVNPDTLTMPPASSSPVCASSSRSAAPLMPLAWRAAAELLRWPSCSTAEAMWDSVQGHPSPSSSYNLVRVPELLKTVNKYFSTQVRLIVGHGTQEARRNCAHDSDTLAVLHSVVQRGNVESTDSTHAERHRELSSQTAPAPFGVVFIVRASQSPHSLPWHVFSNASGPLFRAVLVYRDTPISITEGEKGHSRESATADQWAASWTDACVSNGFEYIPHDDCGETTLEHVAPGVEQAGLLGPTLHGSARLLQLLHSVLWPERVREPRRPAHEMRGKNESGFTEETTRARATNSLLVVASSRGEAALLSRLSRSQQEEQQAADAGTASTGPHNATFSHTLSRYHQRFFTEVMCENTHLCRSRDAAPSNAIHFDSTDGLHARPRALILANRYYTSVVALQRLHPALFSAASSDVLRRLLEQCRGPQQHGQREAAKDENTEEAAEEGALAIVVWPPDGSATVSSGSRLDYPTLPAILDALRANEVTRIVVVTNVSSQNSSPIWAAAAACGGSGGGGARLPEWDVHCCAERGVEMIDLGGSQEVGEAGAGDYEEEEDGPCGIERLHEWLHSTHWRPVHLPAPSQSLPVKSTNDSEEKHNDNISNIVRVCSCTSSGPTTGIFTQARHEEALLLSFAQRALPAFAGGHAAAGWQDLLETVPSLALAGSSHGVRNKYLEANLSLQIDGGVKGVLHGALSPLFGSPHSQKSEQQRCVDAVVVLTDAHTVLEAAANADDSLHRSTAETASVRLVRILTSLQRRLVEENEAATLRWTTNSCLDANDSPSDTLVLLYIHDVPITAPERTEEVEAALQTIVAAAAAGGGGAQTRSEFSDDENEEDVYPLFERVWGQGVSDTKSDSGKGIAAGVEVEGGNQERPSETESGPSRLREALTQHLWPHRTERHVPPIALPSLSASRQPSHAADAPPSESEACDDGSQSQALPDLEEAGHRVLIGCELPPNFLVDPETLRSVRVHALSNVIAAQPRPPSRTAVRGVVSAVGDDAHTRRVGPPAEAEEIQRWVESMRVYGARLSPAIRQHQAAVLALAMEEFL